MSSVSSSVADLPLRPLLLADGAAATAVSIYCSVKQGDGDKTFTKDPVCKQDTEPALVRPTEVLQDQMTEDVTESEEKIQKLLVSITQLEDKVETLRDTVKECEREREAYSILQAENDKILKTLIHQKELMKVSVSEAEEKHQKSVETIAQLGEEKSDLTKQVETLRDNVEDIRHLLHKHNIEPANLTKVCMQQWEQFLKVSVAKAEEKHQKALETIAQLKEEKSDVIKQVETLRDAVKECERERETHSILQTENNKILKTLIHQKELINVSVSEAEEKHQKDVETIAQLEEEKSDLTKQVETLRDNVEDMRHLLHKHNIEAANVTKACVQEWELLKVSMTGAEVKHQKDVEIIAQLEEEKSDLKKQVESLRDTVKECEKERETHSILQTENEEMMMSLIHQKQLITDSLAEAEEKHQVAVEIIAQQEKEKCNLLKQVVRLRDIGHLLIDRNVKFANLTKVFEKERDELLKVSMAKTVEKHQKDVETIAQLEEEKSNLIKQVERLRDTVQDMGNDLFQTHRACDELINNHEREAHRVLQAEYAELQKNLMHKEELLKVSMTEAEKKPQKDVEIITQLEEEKSDLTKQVESMRDTVKECERERETHSILQTENNKILKTLIHEKELMKVSLTEAEEKHQKALETIAQLQKEKSDLSEEVDTLRKIVQDMGNDLFETHRECDRLTDVCILGV